MPNYSNPEWNLIKRFALGFVKPPGGYRRRQPRKRAFAHARDVAIPRFRERTIPAPFGDTYIKFGTISIERTPLGSNVWDLVSTYNNPIGMPFMRAESTMDEIHGGPPYLRGGPFRSIKIGYGDSGFNGIAGHVRLISNYAQTIYPYVGREKYEGILVFTFDWPNYFDTMHLGANLGIQSPLVTNTASLEGMVWNKTKPKIEQGGLFVAIAEIRDTPRMLRTTLHGFHEIWKNMGGKPVGWRQMPRTASDHFVNHNFGWVPFVKDVYALCDNVINASTKIDRLTAENGKWVRRRAILVNQEDHYVESRQEGLVYVRPLVIQDFYAIDSTGHYCKPWREIAVDKFTFAQSVGSFRYYVPEFDRSDQRYAGIFNTVKRQIDIHGARINPSNVYKAIPWTWLIDWVSNTGSLLQAIQDQTLDNMAARYLFLTHRQVSTRTIRTMCPFNAASGGSRTFELTQFQNVKQRKEAESPYGFGSGWENLSPKQLAILGALGILRTK